MTRHIKTAEKTATNSKHPQHFMGCVVVRGGAVLSRAHNLGPHRGHAEARALRPKRDFRGADLYVVRLNGKRTSRPCPECANKIKAAGIATVIYTDASGQICRVQAENL